MNFMKAALLFSAGALLLSACGGSGESADPEESASGSAEQSPLPDSEAERISVTGSDPRIVVHELSLAPGMALSGRLEYVEESKSLVVRGKRADEEYTACAIWPKGVQPVVSGDRRGVEVPGFGTLLEGDTVVAAGNFWKSADARAKQVRVESSCRAEDGFIVFNADSFEA
ncbi:hypothetical protein [Streptomyces sp. NPDC126514]|uniref:hypothetical protein n=1 Tax=Streptomyces sp. NPDC126514 TaxID=3155210 RepID=UPI00332BECF3